MKAVDVGLPRFAYNAANRLMDEANDVPGYLAAARYFQIAMADDSDPKIKAAAHVNYCPIVRDGLITGKPDHKGAVEIYEVAAEMGLIKAMFNAGNVSRWLSNEDVLGYGERSRKWFQKAIDTYESGVPVLDMEPRDELAGVIEQAKCEVGALNIDRRFPGADLDRGIDIVFPLALRGNESALSYLDVGLYARLTSITAAPSTSPGLNWRTVLVAMGWKVSPSVRRETHLLRDASTTSNLLEIPVDQLDITLDSCGTFPLLVVHFPCLPMNGGIALLTYVANEAMTKYPQGVCIVGRRAIFAQRDRCIYTPMLVALPDAFALRSLWLGATPDLLIAQTRAGVDFDTPEFSCTHCMISISVNALDEGFSVAEDACKRQIPYMSVGDDWRTPYLSEQGLLDARVDI